MVARACGRDAEESRQHGCGMAHAELPEATGGVVAGGSFGEIRMEVSVELGQIRLLLDRATFTPWPACAFATLAVPCLLPSSSSVVTHRAQRSHVITPQALGGDGNGNRVLAKPGSLETDAHSVSSKPGCGLVSGLARTG